MKILSLPKDMVLVWWGSLQDKTSNAHGFTDALDCEKLSPDQQNVGSPNTGTPTYGQSGHPVNLFRNNRAKTY
ncbi:unnamed protein product [Phytophthora fragariaefolia]|uniref:Unnamed protein product n=1 Tax=Phytophthora fragariaefolia TaxID=1490495 RepID=A0A9W6U1Z4_9STRA|nr:unnamed protein product [Phytophthora fragariaefolia]